MGVPSALRLRCILGRAAWPVHRQFAVCALPRRAAASMLRREHPCRRISMAAYVVVEIDVHDPAAYEAYMAAAEVSIARHGGKYLARGGTAEALEGAPPKRMVILQFADAAAAKRWFHSPDYQAATTIRQSCSTARFVVVAGL
jgi:uncharacterized protein (DUF1330 family)